MCSPLHRAPGIGRTGGKRSGGIEWSPALNEKQNLLRYLLKFEEQNGATAIDISQQVELRRKRAWDLHPGVGLMGEARLSNALQRRINEAIENFLERVKEKLEK